jgi:UDP-glucose 4-epimerase
MKLFVTGGAGFIGSAFVESACANGHHVKVWDSANGNDLRDRTALTLAMQEYEPAWVIHLAATPGVSSSRDVGIKDIVNTDNLLHAMQATDTKRIMFVSTGSVYGRQWQFPTVERAPMHPQEGYYANAKLACEGMINVWASQTGATAVILRLGSIMGPGNNKGFARDFVRRLQDDPTVLNVWGDGRQIKSYLHINDMVSAMWRTMGISPGVDIFNVAHDRGASIRDCIPWVCEEIGIDPIISYGDAPSGTFGDIPTIRLSNAKLRGIGWAPTKTIEQAVRENVRWLLTQEKKAAA